MVTGDVSASARAAAFAEALLALDEVAAERLLNGAGGPTAADVDEMVVPALVGLGDAWEAGEIALSQLYLAGRMCERLLAPPPGQEARMRPGQPRVGVVVLDDAHVLGKQIVEQMLRSAGYAVVDLGATDVVDDVVAAVVASDVEVLVVSVLMLRSALLVADLRAALRSAGRDVVLVVGGAPFRLDPLLAHEVGADHSGASASDILPIVAGIEASRS